MKALITLACSMLVAFTATAGPRETIHRDTTLYSDSFASKQEAIDAGFNMYEALETASDSDLRWKLNTTGDTVIGGTMVVESAQVKIEEFPASRHTMQYRAIVEVDYNYKAISDN